MSSPTQGRELLEFIEQLGDVAWAKFESRRPIIATAGRSPMIEDRSARPPYTSFRFQSENAEVIDKLRKGVEGYRGAVEWVMQGHRREEFPGTTNWIIQPKKVADIRAAASSENLTDSQYMERFQPEFGPVAYFDLPPLAHHLRALFGVPAA